MRKSQGYAYYLLWMIGAILLVYYGNQYLNEVANHTGRNQQTKVLGTLALYSLFCGIYVSLIYGFPGRSKFNKPIFISIFIPSFVLLVYSLVSAYMKLPAIPHYAEITGRHGQFFFGVICGIALVKSLFDTRK
ncbi:CHASE3 domain sensor protein [Paenibacillus shirakamiensis]|uniref:CHASE3 domain sensor protein n=1 Tax=Paenibacillus shirakamiensis TaxID=1265935 RepID=A0ABS4JGU7_9BACL|nr:hypothetical protein [Paenibacillus shirakamiensis]MBP2000937.1 CHASE3 domain sensor protein [Paenibacillus shirakamiensis]